MKKITLTFIIVLCTIVSNAQNGLDTNLVQAKKIIYFHQIKLDSLETPQLNLILKTKKLNYSQSNINKWKNSFNSSNYIPIIKGNPNGWDFPANNLNPFNARNSKDGLLLGGLNFLLDITINNK